MTTLRSRMRSVSLYPLEWETFQKEIPFLLGSKMRCQMGEAFRKKSLLEKSKGRYRKYVF